MPLSETKGDSFRMNLPNIFKIKELYNLREACKELAEKRRIL